MAEKLRKLNLGSGARPREGWINLDITDKHPNIDVVHNLDQYPWPFEDDSIDEIWMNQVLEHVSDPNRAMQEIHRILKKGCTAQICVPHFTWQYAYTDPTHKTFYAYNTFFYYAGRGGYFDFQFSSCKVKLIFGKRISIWNYILEPIFNRFPNVYEQSALRMFPALHVHATLVK